MKTYNRNNTVQCNLTIADYENDYGSGMIDIVYRSPSDANYGMLYKQKADMGWTVLQKNSESVWKTFGGFTWSDQNRYYHFNAQIHFIYKKNFYITATFMEKGNKEVRWPEQDKKQICKTLEDYCKLMIDMAEGVEEEIDVKLQLDFYPPYYLPESGSKNIAGGLETSISGNYKDLEGSACLIMFSEGNVLSDCFIELPNNPTNKIYHLAWQALYEKGKIEGSHVDREKNRESGEYYSKSAGKDTKTTKLKMIRAEHLYTSSYKWNLFTLFDRYKVDQNLLRNGIIEGKIHSMLVMKMKDSENEDTESWVILAKDSVDVELESIARIESIGVHGTKGDLKVEVSRLGVEMNAYGSSGKKNLPFDLYPSDVLIIDKTDYVQIQWPTGEGITVFPKEEYFGPLKKEGRYPLKIYSMEDLGAFRQFDKLMDSFWFNAIGPTGALGGVLTNVFTGLTGGVITVVIVGFEVGWQYGVSDYYEPLTIKPVAIEPHSKILIDYDRNINVLTLEGKARLYSINDLHPIDITEGNMLTVSPEGQFSTVRKISDDDATIDRLKILESFYHDDPEAKAAVEEKLKEKLKTSKTETDLPEQEKNISEEQSVEPEQQKSQEDLPIPDRSTVQEPAGETDRSSPFVSVQNISSATENWTGEWIITSTAKTFQGGGSAGFYEDPPTMGKVAPHPDRKGVLYLYPESFDKPATISRRMVLPEGSPYLKIGVCGNRYPNGIWSLHVKVNGEAIGEERLISGLKGWYDLKYDLSSWSGKTVDIVIEAKSGWYNEYIFIDYIQIGADITY